MEAPKMDTILLQHFVILTGREPYPQAHVIQNMTAWIVMDISGKFKHISTNMKEHCWLPVDKCIGFTVIRERSELLTGVLRHLVGLGSWDNNVWWTIREIITYYDGQPSVVLICYANILLLLWKWCKNI